MLQEILYTDDNVLISRNVAELQETYYGWQSTRECKGLKVNLMKTKVMVSNIWQVTVKRSRKKDPCGRKTMLNAILCMFCGHWIHGRCAKFKRVANRLAIYLKCRK